MRPGEARRDYYRRLAKERGYRSRAAFKLIDIQRRFGIVRRGDRVLDLGCYPGGWLQVASKLTGRNGLVIGVDLRPVDPMLPSNVKTVVSDVGDRTLAERLRSISPLGYDVVLSDLSPNISGIWELDHYRQISLSREAFRLVKLLLKNGGNAVFKLFHGEEMKDFLGELKPVFRYVFIYKPRASRSRSSETYVVCMGLKGSREGTVYRNDSAMRSTAD